MLIDSLNVKHHFDKIGNRSLSQHLKNIHLVTLKLLHLKSFDIIFSVKPQDLVELQYDKIW